MESMNLDGLSDFAAVWSRVTGAACPLPQEQTLVEEVLMDRLYTMWQSYRCMAGSVGGGVRCTLLQLAEEAKCCFHDLQTAWFLQQGEVRHPVKGEIFASCNLSNLRKMWQSACEMAEMLHSATADARKPYAPAVKTAESVMGRHPERIRCLISEVIR